MSSDVVLSTIAKIFAEDKSGKLYSNYKESHGVSPDFLRMKTKFVLETLSNLLIKF